MGRATPAGRLKVMRASGVRARLMRLGAAVLAALQLVVGPALAVSDAVAQGRSASPLAVHVEDHSRAECRAPHDERCVVCRQLQVVAAGTAPCPLQRGAREDARASRVTFTRAERAPERRLPPSRAPPIIG